MRIVPFLFICVLAGCTMSDPTTSDPVSGIALSLAQARAERVGAPVEYALSFDLAKGSGRVTGRAVVTFDLIGSEADLPIDFGGSDLSNVTLNGVPLAPRLVENHIVLPGESLHPGTNTFACSFTSEVAPTGTPLTVYEDSSDGSEYYYTLVVPADAHRLFPCFDQPDIKGTFALQLTTPTDWVAVANGKEAREPVGDRLRWTFEPSKPLSTYLFAFAAGPFDVVSQPGVAGSVRGLTEPMRIYHRASKAEDVDVATLFNMHARSVAWQEHYFGYDYPFGKLDIVLCPGFPYGGMEHAGAIFYRETALAFDHEPTELERLRRSTLIYHEVSHQWFGNLVTMRWFDDLWLKEGFATFVGYRTLDALEPEMNAWMRFHQRVKPAALRIDVTEGTTPIWQELDNLADAKSAYGPIVYNKAPVVLRQLEQDLGEDVFRDGVRVFVKRHAFENATWRDLLAAIGETAGTDLGPWSEMWILDRGLPLVSAIAESKDEIVVGQTDLLRADPNTWRAWPMSVRVLMGFADGSRKTVTATFADGKTLRPLPAQAERPEWMLANADGVAFALVTLDVASTKYWLAHLHEEEDPLVKAVAFSALWDTVKVGKADPRAFADTMLRVIERERDPQTWSSAMGALRTSLVRYLAPEDAAAPARRAADLLGTLLHDDSASPIRLQALRSLAGVSRDDDALARVERILDGTEKVPGLELGVQDRFRLVTVLLASERPGAAERLRKLESSGDDVARWAYQARAAIPSARSKEEYFASFMQPGEPPEQWISGALGPFHWPGQEALTLPYLEKALDAAEWVKAHRRIFFMPAWLESFLGGHASPEALAIVEEWIAKHPDLPVDIRRKLEVPLHGLRRAVAIRSRR